MPCNLPNFLPPTSSLKPVVWIFCLISVVQLIKVFDATSSSNNDGTRLGTGGTAPDKRYYTYMFARLRNQVRLKACTNCSEKGPSQWPLVFYFALYDVILKYIILPSSTRCPTLM